MFRSFALCLLPVLLVVDLVSADVVVVDDDFSAPDYSSFSFNSMDSESNPGDVSFEVIGDLQASGGNPGSFLELFHIHDVLRDESGEPEFGSDTFVQSVFINEVVEYTPSVEGPIQSLTFSLDVRTTGPVEDVFFDVSDASGGSAAGFMSVINDGEWHTVTLAGATNADFTGRDFAGSDPLSFGFGFISDLDVFSDVAEVRIDVDNFTVTATSVPEPGSLTILGLAALGLISRRRCCVMAS